MKFLHKAFVDFDPTVWWFIAWALTIPLYIGLQAWFGIAWKGRWRIVALIPLAGFVLVSIFLVVVGSTIPTARRLISMPCWQFRWLAWLCLRRSALSTKWSPASFA